MYWLTGIGLLALAGGIVVLGVVALLRADRSDIPDVLRALSRFVGHPDHPWPRPAGIRARMSAD